MQTSQKTIKKPMLSSQKKDNVDSFEKKLAKTQIFYRDHIASIYRQLKLPIYEKLLQLRKEGAPQRIPECKKSVQELIESLYKYASLNSKYRHRQKMRFERTPLLKYIKFDFTKLKELLKTKKFIQKYQDLHDQDQSSDDEPNKPTQYQPDPSFSQQTIINYKKKHNIKHKICIALGYEDLKERLVSQYDWHEVEDHSSNIYDLKFMSKKKNIDYVNLLDSQYINHFQENKSITAKFGLARNIRNLASIGRDYALFFPKCYDINDVAELQDFYEEFKYSQLKSYLYKFINNKGTIYKEQIPLLKLTMEILTRELIPFEKKIYMLTKGKQLFITLEEWSLLSTWKKLQKGQQILDQQILTQAIKLYDQLKKVDPQWQLNAQNIWIVKPASMSRGRGIKTFNELSQIFQYIAGYQISWVVQKYIQRPLIIRKKKFDIRQWVLWTDFKPLRVWIYQEPYIRFCSEIYTPEDLKNRKIHLTNNSVTKGINSQNDGIEGNMMDEATFSSQLQQIFNKQIFKSIIKPQMKKIAIETLQSVLQNVQYRKNSFQVFGYDFMIDEELKVWLIQINSSPTMQYSTNVTTKLVKRGMYDLGGIIENYIMKGKQYKGEKAKELYGGWKLITQQ